MRFDPYAADPTAYGHLLALAGHLGRSELDHTTRALVEVRVSQISGCAFCLGLHAASARRAGVTEAKLDLLAGWRDAPEFDARERVGLALAEEAARIGDGQRVDDATWAAARERFSDSELSSLVPPLQRGSHQGLEPTQRRLRISGQRGAARNEDEWVRGGASTSLRFEASP